MSQITLQAPTDWRAAAFLLERKRFPDDYGKHSEVTGKDGGPETEGGDQDSACLGQPTPELWDEVLREHSRVREDYEMATQTKGRPPLTGSNSVVGA